MPNTERYSVIVNYEFELTQFELHQILYSW